ncbi:MAG TPA: winged helix-turn-helix domain-containing protein [Terriglobales bacterium]|nr:winged helix-turn-helix domain-containing protein [Terriglobales bacterium]
MSTPTPIAGRRIVRFGVFEADLQAGELRKSGIRIRLQEQPFQVLALLLEHPGDVVTRENLREKLWPADTFVDFDHSLNTAINKIREALGDSAGNPRFVETLARRGYRFIAPVQADHKPASALGSPSPDNSRIPRPALHPELEVPIPHRALTRSLFGLIQLMYLIFYVVALSRLHGVDRIADSFLAGWRSVVAIVLVLITAAAGIPLRCYLISAVAFDHRRLGEKFQRLFLLVLVLDLLWALAPFLLIEIIGLGGAFAVTAALLYVPFSERTLIRLAYPDSATTRSA